MAAQRKELKGSPLGICSARYNRILWQNPHNPTMKTILPSRTSILVTAIAMVLASPLSAQQEAKTGTELLRESSASLSIESSFQAEFKHHIELLDRSMVGTGVYRQANHRGRRKYRLDITLRVGDESSSVIQSTNGRFLWLVRDYPGQRNRSRLDLREVRQAEGARTASGSGGVGEATRANSFDGMNVCGIEGLPGTLSGIAAGFDLEAPRTTAIGAEQAWLIEGRIKPAYLERLAPGQLNKSNGVGRVPSHIPTHVAVILSRSDAWPLFPFRIEYRRAQDNLFEPVSKTTPLVSMEFSNVIRSPQFDPSAFEFPAGEENERDITSDFVERFAK